MTSKAKGFQQAKPTKPESQVGETRKSEIPACGGRRGKPVTSIEVGVKIAHVTIGEWQRGVTFITDARAHAAGVKRAANGVSRSTRLEKDALPFVQNGGGIFEIAEHGELGLVGVVSANGPVVSHIHKAHALKG